MSLEHDGEGSAVSIALSSDDWLQVDCGFKITNLNSGKISAIHCGWTLPGKFTRPLGGGTLRWCPRVARATEAPLKISAACRALFLRLCPPKMIRAGNCNFIREKTQALAY